MVKLNGSWHENMGSALLSGYVEAFDIDKERRVIPHGNPEAKVIIQRVKEAEKRHIMLMRKRQRIYDD